MTTPATPGEQNPQPGAVPPPAPPADQPQPAAKKKGFPKWAVSLIVIAVLAVGGWAVKHFTNDAVQAKVGDCAAITGEGSNVDYKAVDCGDAAANYKVVEVLDKGKTCTQGVASYSQTGRGVNVELCLDELPGK